MEERQNLPPYSPLHSSLCLATMLLAISSQGLSVVTWFLRCLAWPIPVLPTVQICTLVHILQPLCWLRGLIKLGMGGTVIALMTFTYVTSSGLLICRLPVVCVELEANYRSYGSPAIAHKQAKHLAHKPIDWINLRLVHHELYCAT